jgi:molybdate transport system substrate-binding protein
VVARGEAALGLQQVSELLPIEGIDFIGVLPPEVQRVTVFSAGISTTARSARGGQAADPPLHLAGSAAGDHQERASTGRRAMNAKRRQAEAASIA